MKVTKRQLRRMIREIAVSDADAAYDDANTAAIEIVENMMNNYGSEPEVVAAIVQALRDAAEMAENDARLM